MKCWGRNTHGQLGIGAWWENRGDEPDEMGDDLPYLDLGTGVIATSIGAGSTHTCVLTEDGKVKCWGQSYSGALGLGEAGDYRADARGKPFRYPEPYSTGSGSRCSSAV